MEFKDAFEQARVLEETQACGNTAKVARVLYQHIRDASLPRKTTITTEKIEVQRTLLEASLNGSEQEQGRARNELRALLDLAQRAMVPQPQDGHVLPPEGQEISVDVSTGVHDALHRVFARLTGEIGSDGKTWLAEMTEDNASRLALPAGPVPDGYVLMPRRLTAENGAKGFLSGEFAEKAQHYCTSCDHDEPDDGCEECDGQGSYLVEVPIEWDTIKRIYDKAVETLADPSPAAAQPDNTAAWESGELGRSAEHAKVAPADCDVRKILLRVDPGEDGEGVEVYAQNVGEVESLLSKLGDPVERSILDDVGRELEDVEYLGSYADGVRALKRSAYASQPALPAGPVPADLLLDLLDAIDKHLKGGISSLSPLAGKVRAALESTSPAVAQPVSAVCHDCNGIYLDGEDGAYCHTCGGTGRVSKTAVADEQIGRVARKIVEKLSDSPVSALSNLIQAIQDADAALCPPAEEGGKS